MLVTVVWPLAACGRKPTQDTPLPAAPTPVQGSGSGSGSAAPADAGVTAHPDARPGDIELLHAVPATVRVSSRVANKSIRPEHLVDRDFSTAWNSRTGDLVGAWIDIEVPGAQIHQIALTVGHTGHGPKGEDYFTMNPRIRRVSIAAGGGPARSIALDITNRGLQTIAVPDDAEHVRLRVEEIEPGSKQSWREICVSELEAWGHPPPGKVRAASTPTVEVGMPIELQGITSGIPDPAAYCATWTAPIEAGRAEQAKAEAKELADCEAHGDPDVVCGDADPPGPPVCKIQSEGPALSAPWVAAGTIVAAEDSAWGPEACQIAVQTKAGWWLVGDELTCGDHYMDRGDLSITDARVGSDGVLRLRYSYRSSRHAAAEDSVMTCTAKGTVTCTPPVEAPASP